MHEQALSWDQGTLLDAVELFGPLASTGDPDAEGSRYHDYNDCGWHYAGVRQEPAFGEYRSSINKLLARYDSGFQLNADGQVERLVGAELVELVEPRAFIADRLRRVVLAFDEFDSVDALVWCVAISSALETTE